MGMYTVYMLCGLTNEVKIYHLANCFLFDPPPFFFLFCSFCLPALGLIRYSYIYIFSPLLPYFRSLFQTRLVIALEFIIYILNESQFILKSPHAWCMSPVRASGASSPSLGLSGPPISHMPMLPVPKECYLCCFKQSTIFESESKIRKEIYSAYRHLTCFWKSLISLHRSAARLCVW